MAGEANTYKDPLMDGSGWETVPSMTAGMAFRDYGSYGLRQYSGWIREEYLTNLVGRNGATAYREMLDGSAVVGAMMFAITQSMRKVSWRVTPASDKSAAVTEADFVKSLMVDMSHTWEDFIGEALSMLGYGFAPHEIVYKRRVAEDGFLDVNKRTKPTDKPSMLKPTRSDFNDGRIGWKRLPIRGQDTILKWFFDENGQTQGLTQQPWVGQLLDIPIQKLLLFRPTGHKNNPEGRSVLRNAYRSHYFVKRLEEQEAILIERMNGFPVLYVPSKLLDTAGGQNSPLQAQASAALNNYKKIVTNVRIDEQMGALLPSDVYVDSAGKPSSVRMYDFQLVTPQHGGKATADTDKTIARHKLDILITLLCDFVLLGHEVRGTNNLAVTKVDMFYAAIEGWLNSIAAVMNRHALPRIWKINRLDPKLMPMFEPDMSQRLDLDSLGAYVNSLAQSGMPMFPDEALQTFLREAAGLPSLTDPGAISTVAANPEAIKKMILAHIAKGQLSSRGR